MIHNKFWQLALLCAKRPFLPGYSRSYRSPVLLLPWSFFNHFDTHRPKQQKQKQRQLPVINSGTMLCNIYNKHARTPCRTDWATTNKWTKNTQEQNPPRLTIETLTRADHMVPKNQHELDRFHLWSTMGLGTWECRWITTQQGMKTPWATIRWNNDRWHAPWANWRWNVEETDRG